MCKNETEVIRCFSLLKEKDSDQPTRLLKVSSTLSAYFPYPAITTYIFNLSSRSLHLRGWYPPRQLFSFPHSLLLCLTTFIMRPLSHLHLFRFLVQQTLYVEELQGKIRMQRYKQPVFQDRWIEHVCWAWYVPCGLSWSFCRFGVQIKRVSVSCCFLSLCLLRFIVSVSLWDVVVSCSIILHRAW